MTHVVTMTQKLLLPTTRIWMVSRGHSVALGCLIQILKRLQFSGLRAVLLTWTLVSFNNVD
jgi:hypothetical protein